MPVRLRETRDLFFRIEDGQIMVTTYAVKGDAFRTRAPAA
jgi:hypothetical protein